MLLDQREHGGELGEDQDAAAFLDEHGEQLGEEVEFRGFVDGVGELVGQQARIAADLAELEQGVEEDDLELAAAACGDGLADAFVHGGADGFVEVLLRGVEFDEVDEFGFRRQFLGHLVLGAAEDERGDAFFEHLVAVLVAVFFDGFAEARVEGLLAAEEAGDEEFHQAPQLAEVVFHGRAGEAEPVACIELAGGLRDLGMRVLDVLRLVEHDHVVGERREFLDVAVEQREGREHEVGVRDGAVVFAALRAVEHEHAQVGVNLSASARQFGTTEVGATTSAGFAAASGRMFFRLECG